MADKKVIYVGSDHAGYELKEELKKHLAGRELKILDLGAFSVDVVDYPDIAREVCEKIIDYPGSFGLLICGTGTGMNIMANKQGGIRSAVCTSEEMAQLARQHNDANVLCLGARLISNELAKKILDAFLDTEFSGEERHKRRIDKMEG